MILTEIQNYIEKKKRGEFIFPCYDNYCFSNIPTTLLYLLGKQDTTPFSDILDKAQISPQKNQKVVLLLLDGFGYNQWLKYAEKYKFLKQMTEKGVVSPLTAVFPSTTSAALTTIHTGLTPQQHGLPEWFVYFDELDQIISTLPFSPAGKKEKDSLLKKGIDPKILFNGKTIYKTLAESDIPSFTFIRNTYSWSTYSKLAHNGSETIPFLNLSDLLVNLRQKITDVPGSAYFHVYWDMIDAISHEYGPHSPAYLAELNSLFHLLYEEFLQKIDPKVQEETVILITADHGHININPKEVIYLNQYSEVVDHFQFGPSGTKILPWGSPRDIFLAVREEKLDTVFNFLIQMLEGKATVMKTETAFEKNLFGPSCTPHEKFKSRIGNLLILPHNNQTIWYKHPEDLFPHDIKGLHGGLSADEMLIPFAVAKGSQF